MPRQESGHLRAPLHSLARGRALHLESQGFAQTDSVRSLQLFGTVLGVQGKHCPSKPAQTRPSLAHFTPGRQQLFRSSGKGLGLIWPCSN